MAGSWLMASVYIERINAEISSANFGRVRQQLAQPTCRSGRAARNLKSIRPAAGRAWLPDMPVRRWPMRTRGGQLLAVALVEQRLVVERLESATARRS